MKNSKYLFLLLFVVMISVGFVSAADNDTAIDDTIVKHSSATDVKAALDIDTVEYTVKSTSELNSIVNDAKTEANTVVINVDKENFKDDTYMLFNFGNHNQSHKGGNYNPLTTVDKTERYQTYKNLVINANNATFNLNAAFDFEELNHISMDISTMGDDTLYCGIIEVGKDYTLTFNNVNLEYYDMLNFGTVIFNNSSLTNPARDDFVVDNHGTIIIENSLIDRGYTYCDVFANYENGTVIVSDSQFKEEGALQEGSGSLFAGGTVIIDGQINETSEPVFPENYQEHEEDHNDSTTEKINSMISFGDIEGTVGEVIPVNIYVTDFDGNKINGGYVNIYFVRDGVDETLDFYQEDESGKEINLIDSTHTVTPMNFEVIDGVVTAYVLFTRDDYSDIKANYSGTDNVNPADFYKQQLSLDLPLRNASINVINEEQTADNVTLTVEVKDMSGSKVLDYLDEDGLSFSVNNGPDYETPEISHTHYYEENGMFYVVFAKDELDKSMDSYYAEITYINPAYNEVSTTYSFEVNNTTTQNTTPKENTNQNHSNSIKPVKKVSKVAIKATPKKVNKVLPNTNLKTVNTVKTVNGFTLGRLNELFNMDFSNQTLLIYIGDTLVYNGTTTDDLLEVLFNLTDAFKGNYTITVKTGNDTYNETITI